MNPAAKTLNSLQSLVELSLGEACLHCEIAFNELSVVLAPASYSDAMRLLRDTEGLQFEQLIDLCAVDYSDYKEGAPSRYMDMPRYCVVVHLLSIAMNQRLRVKVFLEAEDFPVLPSVTSIWSAANWYEREAFDLFGVVFDGHPDLRRILTDYGFIGHPMRKDFPLCGTVEMRYDPEAKRVVYQPVTIEMRDQTPRIVREEGYGLR